MFVYVCFMFAFMIGFVNWLDRGLRYICEKSLETCICLWPEFDGLEVTLCGWQDIKIQLLLLLLLLYYFVAFFIDLFPGGPLYGYVYCPTEHLVHIIIIMYIYCTLINTLSTHMIHIYLNMVFYTHVEHSPIKNNLRKVFYTHVEHSPIKNNLHKVLYGNTHTHTHTHTNINTHTHTPQ